MISPLKYLYVLYLNDFPSLSNNPLTSEGRKFLLWVGFDDLLTSADVTGDVINTKWTSKYRTYLMLSNDTKHYLVYDEHRYEKGIWISPTPNFSWKKHWEETSQIWDFLYLAGIVDLHTRSQND